MMKNEKIKSFIKQLIKDAIKITTESAKAKDLPTLLKMARQSGKGQIQRPNGIRQLPPTEPDLGASAAISATSNRSFAGGNSAFPQQNQKPSNPRLGTGAIQMFTDGKELWYGMGNWFIRAADLVSISQQPLTANQPIDTSQTREQ